MNEALIERLARGSGRTQGAGAVQERARPRRPPGRRWCAPATATSSICAPTTIWAWPITPRCARPRTGRIDRFGYGMASVRFICGTQSVHKQLEEAAEPLPGHRGHDPLLLLLRCQRRPVRDAARRAATPSSPTRSITRASSTASACAKRNATATPTATWRSWKAACSRRAGARTRLIATDGVFSMDGIIANLRAICDLADRYDALVMVDDSHATGFMGATRARHARALRRRWRGSTS